MIINFKTLGGQGGGEYVLPKASSTTLGGVKIGSGISIDSDGKISADGSSYELPVASEDTLGGVKVGENLSIDENGVLSADASSYELPIASTSTLGGIKVGQNLSIDADGTLNAQGGGSDERLEDVESVAARALCELNEKPRSLHSLTMR